MEQVKNIVAREDITDQRGKVFGYEIEAREGQHGSYNVITVGQRNNWVDKVTGQPKTGLFNNMTMGQLRNMAWVMFKLDRDHNQGKAWAYVVQQCAEEQALAGGMQHPQPVAPVSYPTQQVPGPVPQGPQPVGLTPQQPPVPQPITPAQMQAAAPTYEDDDIPF